AAHQLDWLTNRFHDWGFTIITSETGLPAIRLAARDRLSFRKAANTGAPVVLQTATFDGIVEVSDPDAARRSLLRGVVPGKPYGLGLLTLAPTIPTGRT